MGDTLTYLFITFYLRVLETIIQKYDLKPPLKISTHNHLSPMQSVYTQLDNNRALVEYFSKLFFDFNLYLQKEDFIRTFRFDDNLKLQIDEQNGNINFKIWNA